MSAANSYISAVQDYDSDKILIWERPIEGGDRVLRMIDPPRYFYVPDENGSYTGIDGVKLKKLVFDSEDEMNAAIKSNYKRYESDVRPLARALMDEYYGRPTPIIHFAFLDIEVDYSSKLGFSSPENPYAPINAITIYQSWTQKYLTYAVPPKGYKDQENFQAKIKAMWEEHKLGFEPNVVLCNSERDLLLYMLGDLEDADIISGWNSEFFDLPYIVKRLERVLGKKAPAHLCFKGAGAPRERQVNRFGSPAIVFQLKGRSHLDYLDLFKKFTFEGRTSYSLGNIAAEELDVPKLDYDGTLEQLYNNDFVHFVTYNARDVEVLVKLDVKYKFMQLVNQMAHENTVPFEAILGTVRYVETGIMNRAHHVHNLIATNKVNVQKDNEKVEGAIVMTPLAGLWEWLASVDITSLYPSVIRALNMSIETFIGQFYDEERAWRGITNMDDNVWSLASRDGDLEMTGAQWHALIRQKNWALSAFGTVFDQSKPGMVADTLTFWFAERKRLQAEKKKYGKLAKAETDPVKKLEYEKLEEQYDLLQLTKKIQLNSTYGALLNEAFRFGRREIGASVTGTGRQITLHMAQTIGELITGAPVKMEKRYAATKAGKHVAGELISRARRDSNWAFLEELSEKPVTFLDKNDEDAEVSGAVYWTQTPEIIYGDTDSCYFMTNGTDYDSAVELADAIASETNASFPEFMARSFNCTDGRETLIKAAREVVAERGVFLLAKKKYTLKVVNLEGADLREKPKQKSMGSEIKKADTPKPVQEFLKNMMNLVLDGKEYAELETYVNAHRGSLIHKTNDLLALGSAKQINNLDALYAEWQRTEKIGRGKCKLPGHVRAAVNYNELILAYDEGAKSLRAGDKGVIFYLRKNPYNFNSIAFPADAMRLPEWFVENFQIDNKIEGIFDALGFDLPTPQTAFLNTVFTF
jgi:DNA polymerase elongation subunit (family B)